LNQARFENLWSRCCPSGSSAESLFNDIRARYAEPHRRYHTGAHIEHCLRQLDLDRDAMGDDADAIEMALWFHDVEYDPGAADNELKSAERFKRIAAGKMNPELIEQIYRLILSTIHNGPPQAVDEQYAVDIDLSGFGLPWHEFVKDSINVRNEFPGLTDCAFAKNNGRFLKRLLDRPSVYSTEFFKNLYEHQARENMEKQIALLKECKS
jgi:predicted metal-dependent HD superfamily phosphohydrolase